MDLSTSKPKKIEVIENLKWLAVTAHMARWLAVCQDPSDIHCSQTLSSVGPVPRVHRFKRDGEVQRKPYLICLKAPSMGPNSPSQIPVVQY